MILPLMAQFLIRYGELGLKSKGVRERFQRILVDNIQTHFMHHGIECRTSFDYGRVYLWTGDGDGAKSILARIFGVVSFSEVVETTSDLEDIKAKAAELSRPDQPVIGHLHHPATDPDVVSQPRGGATRTGDHSRPLGNECLRVGLPFPDYVDHVRHHLD